jgi:hypothetical protein
LTPLIRSLLQKTSSNIISDIFAPVYLSVFCFCFAWPSQTRAASYLSSCKTWRLSLLHKKWSWNCKNP